jgi:C-terminal processing protease CtpA/Prc
VFLLRRALSLFSLLITITWPVLGWSQQPQMSNIERGVAQDILKVVAGEIEKHYYDPKFHNIDWNAKVAEAKQKIASATSFNMAMAHIAAMVDQLNDSHTFMLPPQHAYHFEPGFRYQMVGNGCFVTQVRPQSDADTKGLKAGDQIVAINGYDVNREILWKMRYGYTVLRPQPVLRLAVQAPSGAQREVQVAAEIRQEKLTRDITAEGGGDIFNIIREIENQQQLMRTRSWEVPEKLLVIRLPEFSLSPTEVRSLVGYARKYPAVILDLRGNGGGAVTTLEYLVGGMFDHDVKIADRIGRKETKPEIAKTIHNGFTGKLIVLIDSESASASEVFARLVQLEKRGLVFGDLSSGSVMESRHYLERMGSDTVIFYGVSVTESNLVMADGNSLEHRGVTPDKVLLPSADDLAAGRDPVLASAAEALGVTLPPEQAGKVFPYEWQRK